MSNLVYKRKHMECLNLFSQKSIHASTHARTHASTQTRTHTLQASVNPSIHHTHTLYELKSHCYTVDLLPSRGLRQMHINLLVVSPPLYSRQYKYLLLSFIPILSFMNEGGNGDETNPSYHPPVASKSDFQTMQPCLKTMFFCSTDNNRKTVLMSGIAL